MKGNIGITILLLFFHFTNGYSQRLKEFDVPDSIENIFVKHIYSDSISSVFFIAVKKSVKAHMHIAHTETIVILSGKAILTLGDSTFKIKKGHTVLIPKGTTHAVQVIGRKPLTLYSIQAPKFIGKDRVWLD